MPAARTADDKFLALLARRPAPMSSGEIGASLGWSRQNVALVAGRLVRAGQVVRLVRERDGVSGRPPALYGLPGAAPREATPCPVPLEAHAYVVTPSNEEARVVRLRAPAHAEIEYMSGPERFQRAVIHVSLLRAFQPGGERPAPARSKGR